jgi:hypothetical protein
MMWKEGAMRTFLPALLATLAFAAPADAATRNFGVNGFDRIRVDGPYSVRLTTGVAPFARAEGNSAALDRVAMDVQGRTLVVRASRSGWGGYPGENSGPVEITIGTHELSAAWVNGSGSLQINRVRGLSFDLSVQGSGSAAVGQADIDQLRVSIAGSGSATLGGRAGRVTALVRGISSLDASGLAVKDATIGAEGPATVRAHVTNAAKIDGSGAATVSLAGSPACTAKLSGSASVSGCR